MVKKSLGNIFKVNGMGIGGAAKVYKGEIDKWLQDVGTGDKVLGRDVETKYGVTDRLNQLEEWASQARQERQLGIDAVNKKQTIEDSWANLPAGTSNGKLGVGFGEPAYNGSDVAGVATQYEAPQQEQPTSTDYSTGLSLTGTFPKSMANYKYTPAPEVADGFPQDMAEKVANYVYSNTKNNSWLDLDYTKTLWNEINQQQPDLPLKDKQALLRTIMDIGFAESHLGADYRDFDSSKEGSNRNRQSANAWNMNFNSNRDYTNNYDPSDRQQMADYLINQLVNNFQVVKNRGLSDQQAHNYHIGPNAAYSQSGVDNYRGLMGGSKTILGDMYQW